MEGLNNLGMLFRLVRERRLTKKNLLMVPLLLLLLFTSLKAGIVLPSSDSTLVPIGAVGYRTADLLSLLSSINYTSILQHVILLSSLGSRVTGYEGCNKAAEYITQYFLEIFGEENVIVQDYDVVVPFDEGAQIIVTKGNQVIRVITAYSLWPNLVVTSQVSNLRGRLIYVGKGELRDFNGKDVEGSIVLMDFNSGNNWLNAAKLGARAVIFMEPFETSKIEAMSKFTSTPLHFPRLYVRKDDGKALLEILRENPDIEVVIESKMKWKTVRAKNIIGVIHGSEYPDDIIVVAAHYDTWSVVPKLAYGADEAVSIATLMEIAKWFKEHRPRYTLWFVALSGHWQALAGAREFTERFFFDPEVVSGKKRMWMFVAIDLSTDTDSVAFLYRGHMYSFGAGGPMLRWLSWLQPRIFNFYLPLLINVTGRTYKVRDGFHPSGSYGWWASIPEPYMLDSEPWATAHGLSFTIRTDETLRLHFGTPLNDLEKVNIENLKPQVEVVSAVIYGLTSEERIGISYSAVAPMRYLFTAAGGDMAGFMTVKGKVWVYNITRGWYSEVPGALVVACRVGVAYSSYPFSRIIVMSDENGEFTIHGLSGYGYGHGYGRIDVWRFEAYKLNEVTGAIEYAPDLGQYGEMQIRFSYELNRHPYEVTTIVFKATPVEVFDIIDVTAFRPHVVMNPVFRSYESMPWTTRPQTLMLLDVVGLSQFVSWGSIFLGYETSAVLFLPSDARGVLLYKSEPAFETVGLLLNASQSNPEGEGFGGLSGTPIRVHFTAYRFARDMLLLTKSRYERLNAFKMRNPVIEFSLTMAQQHLEKAELYYKQKIYDKAYGEALAAWSYAVNAYTNTMSTIYDTVNTGLIVFLILIFFAIFFERLTISARGALAMLTITAIFALVYVIYINLHPAPKIAANILIGPLSLTSLLLFVTTLAVFQDRLKAISREFKEKEMGKHIIERTPASSLVGIAMSQAPRNIRAHSLRSLLTFLTVAATIFSIIALTSVSPTLEAKDVFLADVSPVYQGLLIKRDIQYAPDTALDFSIVPFINALSNWSVTIVPRVWYYPPSVGGEGVYATLRSGTGSYPVKALVGMSSDELSIIKQALIEGGWFSEWDYDVCLLPRTVAKRLNVSVGDIIEVFQFRLLVRGIFEPEILNSVVDYDKYTMTPADPSNIQEILLRPVETQTRDRYPLPWDQVIIVPYKLAVDLGGFLASVTVVGNEEIIRNIARNLALLIKESKILYGTENKVFAASPVGWFTVMGMEFILVPLALASMNLASIILASVKEREREIKTYSSVGLAPSGVILVFITEAVIYALIGCVFGYFLGIIANIILVEFMILPQQYVVNYTSTATLLGIGIPILAAVVSALIPSYTASRIVTPSLERKWKITTRPRDDVWEIPLPYGLEDELEVKGVLMFLSEYLASRTVETEDPFIVQSVQSNLLEHWVMAEMQLIPFESGVWQDVKVVSEKSGNRWVFRLIIKKKSGVREVWISRNYRVADAIRKQLLLWRSLPSNARETYIKRAESVIKGG